MSLLLENYNLGYRIVSLALDETAKAHLLADNLELIYVENEKIVLLPDGIILSERMADISKIQRWNNYDVLDILENGLVSRKYNDKSDDNYFFVTGGCNSNCIMCPSPDVSRKNVSPTNVEDLISLAKRSLKPIGRKSPFIKRQRMPSRKWAYPSCQRSRNCRRSMPLFWSRKRACTRSTGSLEKKCGSIRRHSTIRKCSLIWIESVKRMLVHSRK